MTNDKTGDAKADALSASGTLYKNHRQVVDELFQDNHFFDPHDVVQVKYEMLRRVKQDQWPVTRASETYGFSRFAYYETEASFKERGLYGLLPRKKGPRRSHKLSDEILTFVTGLVDEKEQSAEELAEIVRQHFAIAVHPRSIGRAVARWKKKR